MSHAPWARRVRATFTLLAVFVLVVALTVTVISNRRAVKEIQRDRAARIAAADKRLAEECGRVHDGYLATVRTHDLLDELLHQTDINDPRIPPDLRDLAAESRAKAEASLSEARASAAKADCTIPTLP